MTRKESNIPQEDTFHKLSIQVSLNGLSFCVFDTVAKEMVLSERVDFEEERNPFELLRVVKDKLESSGVWEYGYSDVVAIHHNNLFSLVPKALFNKEELPNYLKFNAKILVNDLIDYDELVGYDIYNVYVPFINVNNYLYEHVGEFEFMHSGTVLIQALMNMHSGGEPVCYVHITPRQMDVVVISQKQLQLYNNFTYRTKEDFIYYLLFVLEQLKLDPAEIKTRLFGMVTEEDDVFKLCQEYINNISIFVPEGMPVPVVEERVDFTVINTL